MRGRLHRLTTGRTAPVVCIQKASARGPDVDRARVCSGPSQLIAPPIYGLRSCELAFVANTRSRARSAPERAKAAVTTGQPGSQTTHCAGRPQLRR